MRRKSGERKKGKGWMNGRRRETRRDEGREIEEKGA